MKNKKLIGAVLVGMMAGSVFTMPATAAMVTKTIQASYGINLNLNGQEFVARDNAGKKVEPMVVNGVTYLPLRALGQALDLNVKWDGATSTVYLSETPFEDWVKVDQHFINNTKNAGKEFKLYRLDYTNDKQWIKEACGQNYEDGFIYHEDINVIGQSNIQIETAGQYETLSFELAYLNKGPEEDQYPNITGVDIVDAETGTIYKHCNIGEGNNVFTANIAGANKIKLDNWTIEHSTWWLEHETRTMVIGNVKLK